MSVNSEQCRLRSSQGEQPRHRVITITEYHAIQRHGGWEQLSISVLRTNTLYTAESFRSWLHDINHTVLLF